MSTRAPALYDDPELYDLIHHDGTDDEVWLLDLLFKRHGNGGHYALEPACGTGRYLEGLLKRKWHVCGYDRSYSMVQYAKKRLSRWKEKACVVRGDMSSFRPDRKYDLAFNLLSTFRHLMTEREALAHLNVTSQALSPGGIFILGLDLTRYGEDEADEEAWTIRRRGRRINHVMMTVPPEHPTRRERIVNFVTEGRKIMESSYDLRSYDAAELGQLLRASPFGMAACYGLDGKPAEFGGPERALWLVLRNR